ncbi:hypothetical protein [Rhodobacter xanthinilyticus]|uniref:hypothetical protein n=1 Tax=Rhodobacter xanthinilyticus TaxID=1850250 RepID=UPI0012EBB687|nr:hypothetical protein [Rhodobacter xanthinilyticus]
MSQTPTPEPAPTPEALDMAAGLKDALKTVDGLFGIEKMLRDEGEDRTKIYYEQSRIG